MSNKISSQDQALSTAIVDKVVDALAPLPSPFRTAYDGLNAEYSDKTAVNFNNAWENGESMTKQSFRDECDVNRIMDQFEQTGVLPIPSQSPLYGDFTLLPTYQEAQNFIITARQDFEQLPSDLRARFDNDPAKFLEYADNPDNADEMRKLGLLPPLPPEAPTDGGGTPAGDAQRPQTAGGAAPADGAKAP